MPLVAEDISVDSAHGVPLRLLDGIDGTFADGTVTLLVGASGAGKTTLLQTLCGLSAPAKGRVCVDGRPLYQGARANRAALLDVAYVPQFPEEHLFAASVRSEIDYSLRPYSLGAANDAERARAALTDLAIADSLWPVSPLLLSGGQKRRVAIAAAIAPPARWLLLDEPTAGLDAMARQHLLSSVANWHTEHSGGVIIATHDLDELLPLADTVWLLDGGHLHSILPAADLYADASLLAAIGMAVPESLAVVHALRRWGVPLPEGSGSPSADEVAEAILGHLAHETANATELAVRPGGAQAGQATNALAWTMVANPAQAGHATPGNRLSRGIPDEALAGWAARLDPRAKWLFFLALTLGLFQQSHVLGLTCAMGAITACALCLRVQPRALFAPMRPVLWIVVVSSALGVLSIGPGIHHVFSWDTGHVGIALQSGWLSLLGSLRFVLALAVGVLLPIAITRLEMKRGLEQLLGGLWRVRFPVQAVSLALTLILRFIPLLGLEAARFSRIAMARGKVPGRRNRIPLGSLPAMMIPFILAVLRLGEDTVLALEARGVKGFTTENSNAATPAPWRLTDWLTAATASAVLVGLWWVARL